MLSTTDSFTTATPLPATLSKASVLKTLHNPQEMIQLNPLVIKQEPCDPHPAASSDELEQQHNTWYEITDRLVPYLPFTVSYKSSFRNVPDGLRTHVYAPLGLEIKGSWTVVVDDDGNDEENGNGNGSGRLKLREDVEMTCNAFVAPFVKKSLTGSHAVLVRRLVEKARSDAAEEADQ